MNPQFLWLVDAVLFLALFVCAPALGFVIAYAAWSGKPQTFDPERYGDDRVLLVVFGVSAFVLLIFAKLLNADVRTAWFLLQLACFMLGSLLFGVAMGCCCSVFMRVLRWHKATRLSDKP